MSVNLSRGENLFMKNSIAKEFHFFSLLKFAFPSMIMMIFTSLYTMIDGIFVSRFIGTNALSAVNIVFPLCNIIMAIGIMLGTGGSAVIAKKLGEGKNREAKENFSLITVAGAILGLTVLILCFIFIEPILEMLGTNEVLYKLCYDYATVYLLFAPLCVLQLFFQYLYVAAGKPTMGLIVTIIGGVTNAVLDFIFIAVLDFGVKGAAFATGIGILVPAMYGLLYFSINRKGSCYLVKPKMDKKVLLNSCSNGASEMVSNIALSVVTILFNLIMMRLLGEDGVAAITIMLYAQFFLSAIFMGFSMGVAPVISYNYGSQNINQIKKVFKYCMIFILVCSILCCINDTIFSPLIITIFAAKGSNVYNIAMEGFGIFSISFLFAGINIFTSSLFTAFSNGKVSAIIAFMRTFVFITVCLVSLPALFGVNGVWISITMAELLSTIMCFIYIIVYKKKYHYI